MRNTPYYIYILLAIACIALPVKATVLAPEQTEVADSTTTSHYIHQIAIGNYSAPL